MGREQSRGAPLKPLDDPTPITGATIDVAVRIGWLLRMARLTAPGRSVPRLADMVTRLQGLGLSTSSSSLHRVETGAVRDDRVVEAYERALGLQPGSLRACIDIVCRTFPYAPTERAPLERVTSPEEMSRLHEPVLEGRAHGGQWRDWARALAQPGNIALPASVARERVVALMQETVRAVGCSYLTRYDALALLRRSAYGEVVRSAAAQMLDDPHVQIVNETLSAVGEAADPETRAWLVDLLADPRDVVVQGAAIGLGTMVETHGAPDFWRPVLDRLVDLYNEAGPEGERWGWLSHVLRLLPPDDLAAARPRLAHPPAPAGRILHKESRDAFVRECQVHAEEASAALGLPYQPMLARLLFEVVADGRSSRSQTSALLLATLPAVREASIDAIATIAHEHEDAWLRERASYRITALIEDRAPRVRAPAPDEEVPFLDVLWQVKAGVPLPEPTLLGALRTGGVGPGSGIHAVGWSGSPILERVAAGEGDWPAEIRGAAAWWLRTGSRLQDPTDERSLSHH
ncbi:hypothetical protein [Nocardioides dokdonensis]|uniref:hypothetical protein n=1 Tax=Nocardioides dokdonensis TaxID=450734 RepID=UPI00082F5379|nr:hypothetical protein [Nocardioides dokdonensis]